VTTPRAEDAGALLAPRAEVALLGGYHSPQIDVEVRLNTNECPEPPPAGFTRALVAALADIDFHRYPDRSATALRAAIAHRHSVRADQVFCANGSNEVIQCLLLAYGGPGRSAVVFEPTYALHSHIARLTDTRVIAGHRDESFRVEVAQARATIEGAHALGQGSTPAVVFLCSPNNPTGGAESRATVEAICDLAPGLVAVDEAYGQFAPWSALELLETQRKIVVIRTFSKTWAMAALRLGYLVADPAVVAACERVALPYHLDAVKQAAGVLALEYEPEMLARVARIVEQRGRVVSALGELDVDVWPSDANFVLFRLRSGDGTEVWRRLLEHSVLVRDVSAWPGLEGCLRVTIGTPGENDRFLEALRESLTP